MKYFSKFPTLEYDFSIGTEAEYPVVVTDILVRLRAIVDSEYDLSKLVMDYYIVDGDTMEVISHKMYGKVEYHWTIPFINEKYNYVVDYPLNQNQLEEYIFQKYGTSADAIHHYENDKGHIITGYLTDEGMWVPGKYRDGDFVYNGITISNRDYETLLNESKRQIKVISPDYITLFVSKFNEKLLSIKEGVSV